MANVAANIEILGLIGSVGIAAAAAWAAATLWTRVRMLEREIAYLYHQVQGLQASIRPETDTWEPQTDLGESLNLLGEPVSIDADQMLAGAWPLSDARQRPDVRRIAAQLGAQSPEAIERLLNGSYSFSEAARHLGTGRQEARLLRWLHGSSPAQPGGGRP